MLLLVKLKRAINFRAGTRSIAALGRPRSKVRKHWKNLAVPPQYSPLSMLLLRKEVIQPQVPLRLPCYDFIPITSHTFGHCFPCGFARGLRVQPAFMM